MNVERMGVGVGGWGKWDEGIGRWLKGCYIFNKEARYFFPNEPIIKMIPG